MFIHSVANLFLLYKPNDFHACMHIRENKIFTMIFKTVSMLRYNQNVFQLYQVETKDLAIIQIFWQRKECLVKPRILQRSQSFRSSGKEKNDVCEAKSHRLKYQIVSPLIFSNTLSHCPLVIRWLETRTFHYFNPANNNNSTLKGGFVSTSTPSPS